MANKNWLRDLSAYLKAGHLSDVTLIFGEKTWHIHTALALPASKWFRKAVTIGMKETETRKITLQDEPSFANAIDCMVSYFYQGSYDASKYGTSQALLHAEVVIIADKYDCPSLFTLATSLLTDSLKTMESTDWSALASLIYEHTLTHASAHAELRKVVVNCLSQCSARSGSFLRTDEMQALLRANADLATDLLLTNSDVRNAKRARDDDCICRHHGHKKGPEHLRADEPPAKKRRMSTIELIRSLQRAPRDGYQT